MLKVRATQCATCIYRPDSPLDLSVLEGEALDHGTPDHYARWRACHAHYDANDTVCKGFYDAHGEDCTPIQVAKRLGGIVFIGQPKTLNQPEAPELRGYSK